MKSMYTVIVSLICLQLFACDKGNDSELNNSTNDTTNIASMKLKITIGAKAYTATLNDNPTTTAFIAMLPLTIKMDELNGNEKFFYFSSTLPTNASSGGNIQAGDLMLYGDNCLVLFYENFNTTYSYTRLGKIDEPSGLGNALGSGSVIIKYELE